MYEYTFHTSIFKHLIKYKQLIFFFLHPFRKITCL